MVLADNRPTYRLYTVLDEEQTIDEDNPKHVKDPVVTASKLAPYLRLEESAIADLLQEAQQEDRFQVEFSTINLTEKEKQEIEAMELPGVYFSKQLERFYPNGEFAAHLIGFTKKTDESIEGAMGIESAWDDYLIGQDGEISYQRDKYAKKLLDPEETIKKAENGNNIYLTIDQKIQTFLEDAMSEVYKQYEPEKIIGIVMNPKTGEILGMSNRPSFDPNVRDNIENWYNDVIAYPFEPGSTMKMFTVAAAIDSGFYNGDDIYESGTYTFLDNARPIHDHNGGEGWGPITYDEGFRRSSNVAMAKLVWEKMGTDTFYDYLQSFDLDKETGIDLLGEVKGTIVYDWPSEKLTTSFGQGTTVTPIQLMKAASAIANDGKMVKPYVISKIEDSSTGNVIEETKPEIVGEPISPSTADQVMDLLETVVTAEDGTGQSYFLEDFSVAGKTGTAQIVDPETLDYLYGKEDYIFSFLGMAPKEDPELIMYVAVKQPKLSETEYGSEPVSYIFKTVMENSLNYLEIKPDKDEESLKIDPFTLPDYTNISTQKVKEELSLNHIDVKTVGSGNKVLSMLPKEGTPLIQGSSVILVTEEDPMMPDLTNWSLREVLQFGQLMQLKVEYIGNGYTIKQSIPSGAEIASNQYLSIELELPHSPNQEEDIETNEEDSVLQSEQEQIQDE
jgi:penicillin-binding protein 2B